MVWEQYDIKRHVSICFRAIYGRARGAHSMHMLAKIHASLIRCPWTTGVSGEEKKRRGKRKCFSFTSSELSQLFDFRPPDSTKFFFSTKPSNHFLFMRCHTSSLLHCLCTRSALEKIWFHQRGDKTLRPRQEGERERNLYKLGFHLFLCTIPLIYWDLSGLWHTATLNICEWKSSLEKYRINTCILSTTWKQTFR